MRPLFFKKYYPVGGIVGRVYRIMYGVLKCKFINNSGSGWTFFDVIMVVTQRDPNLLGEMSSSESDIRWLVVLVV